MPNSYTLFKQEIKQWFLENIPTSKRILDVGPGCGTYATLLHSIGYRIDAVEIYEPYVEQFKLRSLYDNVYIKDILNFDIQDYDVIILGDVLEHIIPLHAQGLINKIKNYEKQCLVAVPYMMAQGEVDGNRYETHHQEDLTPEVMKERYPSLVCLYSDQYYGYYTFPDHREEKAYVLYATRSYINTVQGAVNSIRKFSDIPIIVYLLDYYADIEGATVIPWECDIANLPQEEFINRENSRLYPTMIQRPLVIKDALENYAKTVAYVDSDSIATQYVDRIFDYYPVGAAHPYFVEGIYDYLHINRRGGAESKNDLSTTLEHPACTLFGVDQCVRERYRQTGYFVAGQHSIGFLDEWNWMCNHPAVLKNPQWYAPYHEETIVNVLLWKYNIQKGLPLVYVNAKLETISDVFNTYEYGKHMKEWVTMPKRKEELMFLHGEKKIDNMNKMIDIIAQLDNPTKIIPDYPNYTISMNDDVINIKTNNKLKNKPMRILFLPSHLSTGGMPAFLLKRIEALLLNPEVEIYVVEWQCVSPRFIVQRDKICLLYTSDAADE